MKTTERMVGLHTPGMATPKVSPEARGGQMWRLALVILMKTSPW